MRVATFLALVVALPVRVEAPLVRSVAVLVRVTAALYLFSRHVMLSLLAPCLVMSCHLFSSIVTSLLSFIS